MDAPVARGRKGGVGALTLLTVASLLLGAALSLQAYREARHPLPQVSSDILYFRGGAAVSRAALGFDAILADVYWIRAIQHFGGTRHAQKADKSYRLLYPLLDLATTLDPHFNIAYRFGAIFLSEPYPAGPGRTDQAITLLERGLAADPKKWQYAQDAGFVNYWWQQDYKAAARVVRPRGAHRRRALVAALDGRQHACGGRRPSIVAPAVAAAVRDHRRRRGCRNNAQLKLAQLERSMRSTRWP